MSDSKATDTIKKHEVVIVGTGFGGLCAAIELMKRGIEDIVLLERRDFMGGTWMQNRYPGAAVDVQSPLYSLSFEPYDWTQMFAERDELEAYTTHVIDKYRLREKTWLNSPVTAMQWDGVPQRWLIEVNGQPALSAQFVINASGPLSTPVIPEFPGQSRFRGDAFHTNQWNNRVDYRNKRVAIIGSGASAAQVIPAIAPGVKHLTVFQRTPHWVLPRPDYRFSSWQRRLLRNPLIARLLRWGIYWALEARVIGFKYSPRLLDWLAGRPARRFIASSFDDEDMQRKVTPDFTIGCKRVILSNTLYPALKRENVTLMDRTHGIASIDETGINTTDGQHIDADILVYATGFDATDGLISYPVTGEQGQTLASRWEDYPRAYLGTTIPDFPNFFVVTGPNTGIGHTSAIFVIESQMRYIRRCIEETRQRGKQAISVTAEAETAYTTKVHREMEKTVWHNGGCHSWYQSKSGKVIAMFPGFSFSFRRLASRFRPQDHRFS
ncbi:flavin-containing monooxygenase [Alteromonas sp. CYL-A6]|uniref:flavin-containing monooxygenase n=1 Tax=Alteromonas nitratireducens TaxID=3390813 RepID=UPI0034B3D435